MHNQTAEQTQDSPQRLLNCAPTNLDLIPTNAVDFTPPQQNTPVPQTLTASHPRPDWLGLFSEEVLHEMEPEPEFISIQRFAMSSLDMMEMSRFLGILETEFMLLESEVKKVPCALKLKRNLRKGNQCSICCDPIRKNFRIPNLKCGHTFHQKCLNRWAEGHNSCPLCRGSLLE